MEKVLKRTMTMLFLMLLLLITTSSVSAIPACPDPATVEQPNGTSIQVFNKGDEYLGWSEDAEGNLIAYDSTEKAYCYAEWTEEGPVSTGEMVGGVSLLAHKPRIKGGDIPQKVRDKASAAREKETASLFAEPMFTLSDLSLSSNTSPVVADVSDLQRKVLIIHVTWSDRSTILDNQGRVMPKLNGEQIYDLVFNPAIKSVNDYYKELMGTSSDIILPAYVSSPLDGKQGIIEVELPGAHTNPRDDSTLGTKIMSDAIAAACTNGQINLSDFDTDNSGRLEVTELSIGFVIDGFESSAANARTPSFWGYYTASTPAASLTNGVRIERFFGQGAFHTDTGDPINDMLTVGVVCHELGHVAYRFIDMYDYGTLTGSSNKSFGQGHWSLMANGSWGRKSGERGGKSPGYVDAYNLVRSELVTPGILSEAESVLLNTQNDIYLLKGDVSTKQYFLVQQRKYGSVDNYDRGAFYYMYLTNTDPLPPNASNGGMLIYHVDENVSDQLTRIMDKPTHYCAGIEEAHGEIQHLQRRSLEGNTNYGDLGDLWGVSYHEFSRHSDPSSGFYSAFTNDLIPPDQEMLSGITISNISWNSSTETTAFTSGYKDTHCDIKEFSIPDSIGPVKIDQSSKTIKVFMPIGTELSNLTPTIKFIGESVFPASKVAQNFNGPVLYTVTAENGDTAVYTVTVGWAMTSDGLNFSDVYQPSGENLTNSLNRFMYYGTYDAGTDKPRPWYVIGEENGTLVLMQRNAYENENRAFASTATTTATWSQSTIYSYLNNIGSQTNSFVEFFSEGELNSIQKTEVNTIAFDSSINTYLQVEDQSSKDTMFYLMSLYLNNTNVTWSADLDNSSNKLLTGDRRPLNGTDRYWLRSMYFDSTVTNAMRSAYIVGSSQTISRDFSTNRYFVRPVFQLDPNLIVFISEIGGDGIGAIAEDTDYAAGIGNDKSFKLTVVGGNDGADVGTLTGAPSGTVAATGDSYILSGLTATPSGEGDYTVVYKIVQSINGVRSIVGYGSSADLSSLSIDISDLAVDGDYTVHVWLQRNNAMQSLEATMPQYFSLTKTSDPAAVTYAEAFPDENFQVYVLDLLNNMDNGGRTGTSAVTEADEDMMAEVESLYLSGWDKSNDEKIKDLKGIEFFKALRSLFCYNNLLSGLDLSGNTALTYLYCDSNQLELLDVSKNTALTSISCENNQLESLDVSKNTALTSLSCGYNQLESLDVSKNTALTYLFCGINQLESLDVSKNLLLTELHCYWNQLQLVDVSKNLELKYLYCDSNQLKSLDVSKNTALTSLSCENNQLESLDVSKNLLLTVLRCNWNQLQQVDVSKNTALTSLSCGINQLESLDVSKNLLLTDLRCDWNQLQLVDVSKNLALTDLNCDYNQLKSLDVFDNTLLSVLSCSGNQLSSLDVSNNIALQILWCGKNRLKKLDVSKNTKLTQLHCDDNYMKSPDSVVGWNDLNLVINSPENLNNGTFFFYNQLSPVGASMYGDFTGDGSVDMEDILWIQRYAASGCDLDAMLENFPTSINTFCEAAGDITYDGNINATDVLWILRYIVSNYDVDVMLQNFPTTIDFSHLTADTGMAPLSFGDITSASAQDVSDYQMDLFDTIITSPAPDQDVSGKPENLLNKINASLASGKGIPDNPMSLLNLLKGSPISSRGFLDNARDHSDDIVLRAVNESDNIYYLADHPLNGGAAKRGDAYLEVVSQGLDLFGPNDSPIELQAGMNYSSDGYITNLGSANAMVEVLPGMVMLNRDSNGELVAPYPAPRDKYKLGYQIINPNSNFTGNGFIYDVSSTLDYFNYIEYLNYHDPTNPFLWIGPSAYFKIAAGVYSDGYVEKDRYFLMLPAATDYYLYDEDYNPLINTDGTYMTQYFDRFEVEIRLTVDLTSAAGLEWEGAVLIPPRLLTSNYSYIQDIFDTLNITNAMYQVIAWAGEPYGLPYVDLINTNDSPLIYLKSQPAASTTVAQGSVNKSLSVSAGVTDGSSLRYQWYSNKGAGIVGGTPIPGEIYPTFTLPTDLTVAGSPYYYYCVLSSDYGAATVISNVAKVTVSGPTPAGNVIELKSNAFSAVAGSAFTVTASLKTETPLVDMWFRVHYDPSIIRLDDVQSHYTELLENGMLEDDCDLAEFTFTVLDDSKAASISFVEVSGIDRDHRRVVYTIIPAFINDYSKSIITITTQPKDKSVTEGNISGSLTVDADISPSGTPEFRWYRQMGANPNPLKDTLVGTGNSFAIPTTLEANGKPYYNYYYYCVVSVEDVNSMISRVAKVAVFRSVSGDNVIELKPNALRVLAGSEFTVLASLKTEIPIPGIESLISYDSSIIRLEDIQYLAPKLNGIDVGDYTTMYPVDPYEIQGNSDLAVLRFTVLDDSKAAEIYLVDTLAVDEQDQNVEYDIIPAVLNDGSKVMVTVYAGIGGSASGGGIYLEGSEVTVKASPDNNHGFMGWYEDDVLVSYDENYSFPAKADRILEARFWLIGYSVTFISHPEDKTFIVGEISGSLTAEATVKPTGLNATLVYEWFQSQSASPDVFTDAQVGSGTSVPLPTKLKVGTYYYYCVVYVTVEGRFNSLISKVATVTVKERDLINSTKISSSNVKGRPGETVTAAIDIQENPGLAGLQLEIGYDPALVLESENDVKQGPALSDLLFTGPSQSTYSNNPFKVIWVSDVNDYSNGEILYVTFTIPETTEEGTYPITVSCVLQNTCDQTGALIPTITVNGSVTVYTFMYGDVDGDGEVNVFDAILTLQYLNGWSVNINTSAADVDGDGEINVFDVILMLQYLNGWFDKFPVERTPMTPLSAIAALTEEPADSVYTELDETPTVPIISPNDPVISEEILTAPTILE